MSSLTGSDIQALLGSNNEINVENMPACLLQTQGHSSLSAEYCPVPTINVIRQMVDAGFSWKLISKEKSRKSIYNGYESHLIAFDHPGFTFNDSELDKEGRPRLYFLNSAHGRKKVSFFYGIFRFVCLNGLVSGLSLKSLSFRHIHLSNQDVQSMVDTMKDSCNIDAKALIKSMMATQMHKDDQLAFAKNAMDKRLAGVDKKIIDSEYYKLLTVTREADKGDDVWRVLQRVQENLGLNFRRSPIDIKFTGERIDKEGKIVREKRKVSKLSNIEKIVTLNEHLIQTASSYLPTANSGLVMAA